MMGITTELIFRNVPDYHPSKCQIGRALPYALDDELTLLGVKLVSVTLTLGLTFFFFDDERLTEVCSPWI